ncbi:glycosyltransferase [Sagittula sp. NFXS13]|uniref:glycosyltransferase n=1 Tax=Sagittula sp. NFXS13 TaxID=2819095 RepID=UPI0032DE7363
MTDDHLPAVTILMACHQGAAHLEAQLASFAAQEGVDWRLVASDDGSTDGTRAILDRFRADHPGRVILRQGPSHGPPWGAAAHFLDLLCDPTLSDGPVALSDQDDVWYPDKLKQALLHLETAPPGPAAYSARSRHVSADGTPLGLSRSYRGGPSCGNALVENRLSGHATVLNAQAVALVRAVGPVPVPYHDWWLYLLITGAGGTVINDPVARLEYRQHGDNVLGAPRGLAARLARMAVVLGRDGPILQAANRTALRQAHPHLKPEARALLQAIDRAPRYGPARARALRRIGVQRHDYAADAFLWLVAALGRV